VGGLLSRINKWVAYSVSDVLILPSLQRKRGVILSAMKRYPITENDVVSVEGRLLVKNNGSSPERFLMEGIAFPVPIPWPRYGRVSLKGWTDVLEQLANETEINTIRVYELNCRLVDEDFIHQFLDKAAELGLYVVVPLTATRRGGVLDRSKIAPHCYSSRLYRYGKRCVDLFSPHPNVLAGMIGNEVMNSLTSWPAAPCVRSYARDLQLYMADATAIGKTPRVLPLTYAAQHDSIGAAVLPAEAMQLTMDALSCRIPGIQEDERGIDIFGINIESWCSSLQTFEHNENGISVSSYYKLWQVFQNTSSIPLLFTEMGCPKRDFNKKNGILPQKARDWAQLPVVLDDMADTFSGFCAYAYDGNPDFRMMNDKAGPWNGIDTLSTSSDYDNFRNQLHAYHQKHASSNATTTRSIITDLALPERPVCSTVWTAFEDSCKLRLYPMEKMPSHFRNSRIQHDTSLGILLGAVLLAGFVMAARYRYWDRGQHTGIFAGTLLNGDTTRMAKMLGQTKYLSISPEDGQPVLEIRRAMDC
jgi:hypothetical protein